MANTVLPGYTQPWGAKLIQGFEHAGPVLYAAGGETILASDLGIGGFDFVLVPGLSLSGTYYGLVQPLPVDATPSVALGAFKSFKLLWYVLATNAEAGAIDLSGEILRLLCISV